MKKIVCTIMAVAALAACTKSEVNYEAPAEIGFAPATDNITKASGLTGALASTQELGIWAYWDNDGEAGTVSDYSAFDDNYLINALFAQKTVGSNTAWGGSPNGHPWPVNGALVFAGYTTPGDVVLTNDTAVKYELSSDTMTFTGYDNTNEFDLCWFGRTPAYNNRADGAPIEVTLNHAMSWVSIAVYGEGTPVGNWKITSMSLNSVATSGTATCNGGTKKATWNITNTTDSYPIYSGSHTITAGTTDNGKVTGVKLTDNLLIPNTPVELTINYSFPVNGVDKNDSKTVSLKLNNDNTQKWESGVHYTYTLLFKGNEILVAPSYGAWAESNQTVTVE